jgi:hypothetical protein
MIWIDFPSWLSVSWPDVDAIRAEAIEPRSLSIGRLRPLNGDVVLAQGSRACNAVHRLSKGTKAVGKQILNRETSATQIAKRSVSPLKPPVEALDASLEIVVKRDFRDDEALGIRPRGFGFQDVERVKQRARKRLVHTDSLQQRPVHRMPLLEAVVKFCLVKGIFLVVRL